MTAQERYEALQAKMVELKQQLIEAGKLAHEENIANSDREADERVASTLERARSVSKSGALAVKAKVEAQIEELAKSIKEPGETVEKAYVRAIETDLGRSMMRTLEDATRMAAGQPTEAMLAKHRKSLSA